MTSSSDQEAVTFEWNAVCIDCAPGDYGAMIALYRDMLGMEVSAREARWASISTEGRMAVLIQVQDWYVPPVWPEELPAQTKMMHFEVHVTDVRARRHACRVVRRSRGTLAATRPGPQSIEGHARSRRASLLPLELTGPEMSRR